MNKPADLTKGEHNKPKHLEPMQLSLILKPNASLKLLWRLTTIPVLIALRSCWTCYGDEVVQKTKKDFTLYESNLITGLDLLLQYLVSLLSSQETGTVCSLSNCFDLITDRAWGLFFFFFWRKHP